MEGGVHFQWGRGYSAKSHGRSLTSDFSCIMSSAPLLSVICTIPHIKSSLKMFYPGGGGGVGGRGGFSERKSKQLVEQFSFWEHNGL